MTTPFNDPQPNTPNDGQETTPMSPVNNVIPDTNGTSTMPTPAMATPTEQTDVTERGYAASLQQLFQTIHTQLTTGATFTLDAEDPQTATFTFHAFDGGQFTLALVTQGATGTSVQLTATGDEGGRRASEFFDNLDKRLGVAPAAGTHGGRGAAYAAIAQQDKPTSKLAVFAIVIGAFFVLLSFLMNSWGLLVFFAILPVLLSGFSLYTTRKNGKAQGRVLSYVAVGITVLGLIIGSVSIFRDAAEEKGS